MSMSDPRRPQGRIVWLAVGLTMLAGGGAWAAGARRGGGEAYRDLVTAQPTSEEEAGTSSRNPSSVPTGSTVATTAPTTATPNSDGSTTTTLSAARTEPDTRPFPELEAIVKERLRNLSVPGIYSADELAAGTKVGRRGDVAHVDLGDLPSLYPINGTAALGELLLPLNAAVFSFNELQAVEYLSNGSREEFCRISESTCEPLTRELLENPLKEDA
jgi:hypothetical protein